MKASIWFQPVMTFLHSYSSSSDAQYTSYHPQYHVPLHMLLGEPLYLELRLVNPPDLQLVLLVHYCVAYPRSAEAMWVLFYKE